jgi:hypothetical protein
MRLRPGDVAQARRCGLGRQMWLRTGGVVRPGDLAQAQSCQIAVYTAILLKYSGN